MENYEYIDLWEFEKTHMIDGKLITEFGLTLIDSELNYINNYLEDDLTTEVERAWLERRVEWFLKRLEKSKKRARINESGLKAVK